MDRRYSNNYTRPAQGRGRQDFRPPSQPVAHRAVSPEPPAKKAYTANDELSMLHQEMADNEDIIIGIMVEQRDAMAAKVAKEAKEAKEVKKEEELTMTDSSEEDEVVEGEEMKEEEKKESSPMYDILKYEPFG
ncbi:hypothetical protein CSOJ01_03943 [Colletotrichum sojae]|uniref:Uncharacterized protein n=1 Tax=Colletotrichum sojae TaxID=2175907 RepID=A0A8H6JKL8_9PEZI|nr:hypothetical protein CSOJ01_03943 [Colletotrichum sojae]